MNEMISERDLTSSTVPARLGFLGVGWIGRHRMKAILDGGFARAVAIADPSPEMAAEAQKLAPDAKLVSGLDDLLGCDIDGLVIATPSAQHASQSIRALEAGVAVFCQKPLGRNAREVEAVVTAARKADRLLGVDLSYRHTEGMEQIRELVRSGELGSIFAVDLTFHNAYGPDKPWFYDKSQSGGGCVMDLGVHLADLALWTLDFPAVKSVQSRFFSNGTPISAESDEVEDFAVATVELETGAVLRLTCSWQLQAGCDAIIGASFYGTGGGAQFRNVDGSFYDFTAERYRGTSTEVLASPPDAWGGRAAAAWAASLARSPRFDPSCENLIAAADLLDRIYGA